MDFETFQIERGRDWRNCGVIVQCFTLKKLNKGTSDILIVFSMTFSKLLIPVTIANMTLSELEGIPIV